VLAIRFHGKRAVLVVASLVCLSESLLMVHRTVASQETTKAEEPLGNQGNAEAGRNVFNGKGICHYCHGIDGYLDKPPQLAPDTAVLIAQLNPPPADLRNPKTLRLKSDKARAKAIREGHPGTGMFPTTTLTNEELTDTLTYLAALRKEGRGKTSDGQTKPLTGNSTRGEELYQASCVVCHGARAMGGVGPKLAGNPVLSNDQAFWKIVHEGRHVMPPLKGTVTDQQMTDIRAWLRTLP
jgi:mono/diheme cytochrome c family protein